MFEVWNTPEDMTRACTRYYSSTMKRKASQQLATSRYQPKPKFRAALGRPYAPTVPRMGPMASNLQFNDYHAFDTYSNTDATQTTTVVPLNTIAAGDTIDTRDGNKMVMIGCQIRAAYKLEAAVTPATIRWLLIYDSQSNAVSPTWATVISSPDFTTGFQLISTKSRYQILMDKTVVLNSTADTNLNKGFWKKYIKIPQLPAVYGSGAAAVPQSGSLTLIYLSDIAAGVADVDMNVNTRLTFLG